MIISVTKFIIKNTIVQILMIFWLALCSHCIPWMKVTHFFIIPFFLVGAENYEILMGKTVALILSSAYVQVSVPHILPHTRASAVYVETDAELWRGLTPHARCARMHVCLTRMYPSAKHSSKFSVHLVGQSVSNPLQLLLTHLAASSRTLCEGQNTLMNWANWRVALLISPKRRKPPQLPVSVNKKQSFTVKNTDKSQEPFFKWLYSTILT